MAKYNNKTQPTDISPLEFISSLENPSYVQDCSELLKLFTRITSYPPVMWGNIIGYGKYHYKGKSSEGDSLLTGFAARKSGITVYVMIAYMQGPDSIEDLLKNLGKYKLSGNCLSFKKLSDIDTQVLEQIIARNVEFMKEYYKVK